MALRLSGQNCKFSKFPLIPIRDLDTKKTPPNTEVCPEILGAMLKLLNMTYSSQFAVPLKFTWEAWWPYMVITLHSETSCLGSNPGWGRCFGFLGKTL